MYYWQDDQDQVRRLRVLLAARLRAVLAAVPTDVAAYAVTASRRGVAGGTPAYEDGPAGRLALARALRAQGRCQEALGAYQQALEAYRAASRTQEAADCLHDMGTALAEAGHYGQALAALRDALYTSPLRDVQDQADCLYDVGAVLHRAGRYEEAAGAWRQAADLYRQAGGTERQQAACLYDAGSALAEAGRYEEVPAAYQAAVDLYPGLREAGQEEIDLLRTAWSAQCFADSPSCLRRLRRGL